MTAPCYYIHERRKQAASIRRVGRYLMAEMIDPFGRAITYLRVSVTDRCDFRCVYCMAEDMSFLPKKEILSLEELDRRSEEHTSELQSLMRISYAVFCLKKKK